LTIFGGFLANVIKLRLENKQEIKCIKVTLVDEILTLTNIVGKMLETQKTSKILNKSYLDELRENIDSFNNHKGRLFLIDDKNIREKLRQFYKNLVTEVNKSLESSVVGTLNDEDFHQAAKVREAVEHFRQIATDAGNLTESLNDYKYKALWIF
jgi:hypothetical protein